MRGWGTLATALVGSAATRSAASSKWPGWWRADWSNPAVAAELFVSVATVKTAVAHILGMLGLDSRVQLANWIAAQGLEPAHAPPDRS